MSGNSNRRACQGHSRKGRIGGESMYRPHTLAEVARRVREGESELGTALNEFADEFYLDPDKAAQQCRIDPVPELAGNPLIDAWIGAVGEHLAQRWGLMVPDWTQRPA